MNGLYLIFLLLLVGAVVAMMAWGRTSQHHHQRIEAYLREKGATDITITSAWSFMDQHYYTYDVAYTLQGVQRRTRCKIRTWFGEDEIYWSDLP